MKLAFLGQLMLSRIGRGIIGRAVLLCSRRRGRLPAPSMAMPAPCIIRGRHVMAILVQASSFLLYESRLNRRVAHALIKAMAKPHRRPHPCIKPPSVIFGGRKYQIEMASSTRLVW